MTNKNKVKGTSFEKLLVEVLNEHVKGSNWKRVPASGALGTILHEPILTGDVNGEVDSIPKKFKVEAKIGYGGAKQFGLKKEWLDKITEEASLSYSIPVLFGKFAQAKIGAKVFAVLDIDTFIWLLNYITELKEETENRG
jgi:hypothetical protein